MKTIAKFGILFLFISAFQSCFITGVEGSRNVISQNRNIKDSFDKIKVSQGINVIYSQAHEVSCDVEIDDNLVDLLETKVNGNTLEIYFSENVSRRKKSTVYLSAPELEAIRTSSGSHFESENRIDAKKMELRSSSGSSIEITIEAGEIDISTSSGSSIQVEGSCDKVWADASSGSTIEADDLLSNYANADASSGASITVNAADKIVADASSGALIRVEGNPKNTEIDKSSGGSVDIK